MIVVGTVIDCGLVISLPGLGFTVTATGADVLLDDRDDEVEEVGCLPFDWVIGMSRATADKGCDAEFGGFPVPVLPLFLSLLVTDLSFKGASPVEPRPGFKSTLSRVSGLTLSNLTLRFLKGDCNCPGVFNIPFVGESRTVPDRPAFALCVSRLCGAMSNALVEVDFDGDDEDLAGMGMFSLFENFGWRWSGDASGDGEPRKYDLNARYAKTGAGVSGPSRIDCS